MGFRNPVTSATAVDTRVTPGGAGARVYTDNSNPSVPRGIVELSDGFAGDTPARLAASATANPRRQSGSGAGGVSLTGGTYGLGVAPELDLKVVDNGDGSGSPHAVISQPFDVIQSGTIGWATGYVADYGGGYAPGRVFLTAAGLIVLTGVAKNVNTGTINAGAAVGLLPSWASPKAGTVILDVQSGVTGGALRVDINTGGQLIVQQAIPSGAFFSVNQSYYP